MREYNSKCNSDRNETYVCVYDSCHRHALNGTLKCKSINVSDGRPAREDDRKMLVCDAATMYLKKKEKRKKSQENAGRYINL